MFLDLLVSCDQNKNLSLGKTDYRKVASKNVNQQQFYVVGTFKQYFFHESENIFFINLNIILDSTMKISQNMCKLRLEIPIILPQSL